MAITIEQVKNVLDNDGLQYYSSDQRDNEILIPFPIDDQNINLLLYLLEDGELLKFRVPRLLIIPEQHKARLMEDLLSLNNQIKLIKLCLNPRNNEAVMEIDMMIGDNTILHINQFQKCMSCIMAVLCVHLKDLKKVLNGVEDIKDYTLPDDILEQIVCEPTEDEKISSIIEEEQSDIPDIDDEQPVTDEETPLSSSDIDDILQKLLGEEDCEASNSSQSTSDSEE